MAVRTHTSVQPVGYGATELALIQWTGLLNGDQGDWVTIPAHRDISVHAFGTFGAGGTVSIQGSNEVATSPTDAQILNDTRGVGNPVTLTAASIRQVLESTLRIRPTVTAGDGTTSLTVLILVRSGRG